MSENGFDRKGRSDVVPGAGAHCFEYIRAGLAVGSDHLAFLDTVDTDLQAQQILASGILLTHNDGDTEVCATLTG